MLGKNKPIKLNIKIEKAAMIKARTELIFTI
jgi:hypothetical protein